MEPATQAQTYNAWIQPNQVCTHLSQEPQSRSEAQDLLLLKTVFVICLIRSGFWKKPVPHCSEQNFCQTSSVSKTFGHCARLVCSNSPSIRVEARANTTDRAVIDQQIQFMQTTVWPHPTEDLRTADTRCEPLPNISIESTVLVEYSQFLRFQIIEPVVQAEQISDGTMTCTLTSSYASNYCFGCSFFHFPPS